MPLLQFPITVYVFFLFFLLVVPNLTGS